MYVSSAVTDAPTFAVLSRRVPSQSSSRARNLDWNLLFVAEHARLHSGASSQLAWRVVDVKVQLTIGVEKHDVMQAH